MHKCTFDDRGQRSLGKEESMDKQLIIRMPKEVDHHQVKELSEALDYKIQVQGVRSLIFDFRDTEFMDSSGLGLILGRFSKATEIGAEFILLNPNENASRILDVAGIGRLIQIERRSERT